MAAVTPIQVDKAGTSAFFNAISSMARRTEQTTDLVNTLRDNVIPKAEKGTDMQADVGGTTAAYDDLASKISSKLPLQIVVVIALSFLLLMLAFRTVVIPLQAAVMNMLSIGASYGVLTAVFQYGWLSHVIGLDGPVPIVSYVPLFMFAILFGLSMDYEVFLVSQIEEHVTRRARTTRARSCRRPGHERTGDHRGGGDHGVRVRQLRAQRRPDVKQFGVGLAVAVILDATVVRCLLVPALMLLMGKLNWYMPQVAGPSRPARQHRGRGVLLRARRQGGRGRRGRSGAGRLSLRSASHLGRWFALSRSQRAARRRRRGRIRAGACGVLPGEVILDRHHRRRSCA